LKYSTVWAGTPPFCNATEILTAPAMAATTERAAWQSFPSVRYGRSTGTARALCLRQRVRGKAKKAKGKVKEAVRILSGNKKMEREGSLQRAEGAVQEGLGEARRKVGEVLTNLGNAIKK
jgi:uncharacterized protein YjbJ (UPF0337 family)